MTKINPYNFVPVQDVAGRTPWGSLHSHERLKEDSYSGYLQVQIRCLTPLFIPSRSPKEVQVEPCDCSGCKKKKEEESSQIKKTYRRFHHNSAGFATIPGTTLKGCVRTIAEIVGRGCLTLFRPLHYELGADAQLGGCTKDAGLCPTCSLFGTIGGEEFHFKGRVQFEDAMMVEGSNVAPVSNVVQVDITLKNLSTPRPGSHTPFYAQDLAHSPPRVRGRKLYYHHADVTSDAVSTDNHTHANSRILEWAPRNAVFQTKLHFTNLSLDELRLLLRCLELDGRPIVQGADGGNYYAQPPLAHKLGMGKPLGLGSVHLWIVGGRVEQGASRYQGWENATVTQVTRGWVDHERDQAPALVDPHLRDLLCVAKSQQGKIVYPDYQWFKNGPGTSQPLRDWGDYEGSALAGGACGPTLPPEELARRQEMKIKEWLTDVKKFPVSTYLTWIRQNDAQADALREEFRRWKEGQ